MKLASLLVLTILLGVSAALGVTTEFPTGYLPATSVAATLRKVLSPQGRFLMLTPNGPVRLTDTQAKIDDAVDALEKLQHAPALVTLRLDFIVYGKKEVQRQVVTGPQSGGDEFPYPTQFSPPKITQRGHTTVIVPTTPTRFSTQPTGPSQTATITETVQTREPIRRLNASSVPGQPAALPILSKVPEPAALQALAVKLGAVKAGEPAWAAAATELLVRTELSNGQLLIKVTPQLVVPAAVPGEPPRRIELTMCAAGIPMARGAAAPLGTLPRADSEFYRLFMGAAPTAPEATTALSVAADVRYVGSPAP